MLSTQQIELVRGIVSPYEHYAVYYEYDYVEYVTGTERDYMLKILCSDEEITLDNGVYTALDCDYYEVTFNKYISCVHHDTFSLTPLSSSDLVYSTVENHPQLTYNLTAARNFDYVRPLVFLLVVALGVFCICRVIFGGRT